MIMRNNIYINIYLIIRGIYLSEIILIPKKPFFIFHENNFLLGYEIIKMCMQFNEVSLGKRVLYS